MYYEVCPIKAIGGKQDLLTYSYESDLPAGTVVKVPFGRREVLAVVWLKVEQPRFATKPISAVFEENLPDKLRKLADWLSQYYATRLPLVLQTILPAGLEKKRRETKVKEKVEKKANARTASSAALSPDQARVLKEINGSAHMTRLLHGVTGSGKTRIYQAMASEQIKNDRSVLILVPEISLTPQLSSEFEGLGTEVLVLHSQLSESQRHILWQKIHHSDKPLVIVGARSALFAPLSKIGLIVVDECHEPSYLQDKQPKYNALRVAKKLAELHNCALVLGSATPNLVDYYIAKQLDIPIFELKNPVIKRNRKVQLVDLKKRDNFTKHTILSNQLIEAIQTSLAASQQIMLFHNRRGTARMALCDHCGWSAECPNCLAPLRLHHDTHKLRCHICSHHQPLPVACPTCKNPDIEFRGFGSKRIEQESRRLFPDAEIARFDSDTPLSEQLHKKYDQIFRGEVDIIIGTQGLAKGLDLPNLRCLGIVHTDTELFIPDFSSQERAFQLITQVIGRAGRTGEPSNVIIQTLNPDHPILKAAMKEDYQEFYEAEIEERRAAHLPPFTFLLQLQIGYANYSSAERACLNLKADLKKRHPKITVRGPSPAFHGYRGNKYFAQLVVSSQQRSVLLEIANSLPQRWQFTLDPINLL